MTEHNEVTPSAEEKSTAEEFMVAYPPHPRIGERQRAVIQAALAQAFAEVRRKSADRIKELEHGVWRQRADGYGMLDEHGFWEFPVPEKLVRLKRTREVADALAVALKIAANELDWAGMAMASTKARAVLALHAKLKEPPRCDACGAQSFGPAAGCECVRSEDAKLKESDPR